MQLKKLWAVVTTMVTTLSFAYTVDTSANSAVFDNGVWNYQLAFSTEPSLPTDKSYWLSRLKDDTALSALSLPGTHDSMARSGGDLVRTQTMPLIAQLKAGIRVFDFRITSRYCKMEFYHGIVKQEGVLGDDGFKVIRNFLRNYPGEFAIIRLKNEATVDQEYCDTPFANLVVDAIRMTGEDYFWKPNQGGTVQDLRGKMLLLIDNFRWINTNLQAPNKKLAFGLPYSAYANKLQDSYQIPDMRYFYELKWEPVKRFLNDANTAYNNGELYTSNYWNYLSGSPDSGGRLYPYNVAGGRNYANTNAGHALTGNTQTSTGINASLYPDLPRDSCTAGPGWICSIFFAGTNELTAYWINKHKPNHVGTIMADFPGEPLIHSIIAVNDKYIDPNKPQTIDESHVCFYEHANFEGRSKCFNQNYEGWVGNYWDGSSANDSFSSVRLPERCLYGVDIFEHANFEGKLGILARGPFKYLGDIQMNDQVSSIKIKCF